MNQLLIIFVFFFNTQLLTSSEMELKDIRNRYTLAVTDKALCEKMINVLEKEKNNYTKMAYLGAFQTIWARHTFNPISKLNTFKKGKRNLEKAVENAPNDIEIRFLRYSVQKNAPQFLGYDEHLKSDREFLEKKLPHITEYSLKILIQNVLKTP